MRHYLLAASALSWTLVVAGPTIGSAQQVAGSAPADAPAGDSMDVTHEMAMQWSRIIAPEARERSAASGWLAMTRLTAARDNIHHGRTAAARSDLDQVQSVLLNLREAQPIMTIWHRVTVAKQQLEYLDADKLVDDLMPLATLLEAYSHVMPVEPAKADLGKAQEQLKSGKKAEAAKQLQKVDEAIVAIETHLPITRTFLTVSAALDALAWNKPDRADRLLGDAERGLHVTLTALDTPVDSQAAASGTSSR